MKGKRICIFAIAILFCLSMSPTYAVGKLEVVQQNFHFVDKSWYNCYYYLKVENTGDKNVTKSNALYEIYDENGDPLESTTYGIYCYPSCIAPGETGYVYCSDDIDDSYSSQADTIDGMVTIIGKTTSNDAPIRYSATGEYTQNSGDDEISISFTNTTENILWGVKFVVALLDEADNILYVNDFSTSVGLHPGSSFTFNMSIDKAFKTTWAREGLIPSVVDVIAYK